MWFYYFLLFFPPIGKVQTIVLNWYQEMIELPMTLRDWWSEAGYKTVVLWALHMVHLRWHDSSWGCSCFLHFRGVRPGSEGVGGLPETSLWSMRGGVEVGAVRLTSLLLCWFYQPPVCPALKARLCVSPVWTGCEWIKSLNDPEKETKNEADVAPRP